MSTKTIARDLKISRADLTDKRIDLTDERIDRVAKAVDANAAEFDARLIAEGNLSRLFERHTNGRLGELGALSSALDARTRTMERAIGHAAFDGWARMDALNRRLEKVEQYNDRLDATLEAQGSAFDWKALRERVAEIESWADDLVAVQRENADADNKNAEHVYEQLALVEQLASLTAQRLLKAEGEIKAAHARASAAGSRWLGLNARLYVLEGIKNRGLFDRLGWLVFGE